MIKYKKNGTTEKLISENISNSQIGTDFGYDNVVSDKDGIVTNTAIKNALDPINADISEKRIALQSIENDVVKYHTIENPPVNADVAQPAIDDINDWSEVDTAISEANTKIDGCTSPEYTFEGDLINDNGVIKSINGKAVVNLGYQNTQVPAYALTPAIYAAVQTSNSTTKDITATLNGFSDYHLNTGTIIKLYLPNGLYSLAQSAVTSASVTLNINGTGAKSIRYSSNKSINYGYSNISTPLALTGGGGFVGTSSTVSFARFRCSASVDMVNWVDRNSSTSDSGFVTFSPGVSLTLRYDGTNWIILPGQKIATVYFRQSVIEAGSNTFGDSKFAGWAECYSDGTRKWTYSYLYRAILNSTSNVDLVYLKRPVAAPYYYSWYWQKAYKYNCSTKLNGTNMVLPVSNPKIKGIVKNLNYARTSSLLNWTTTMASSEATIAVIEEEGKW